MMKIIKITPGLLPVLQTIHHSAVFEPGMLAGEDPNTNTVSSWDPIHFPTILGIFDDVKGPNGTTCANGQATIWSCPFSFYTDQFEDNVYFPGGDLAFNPQTRKWIPTVVTQTPGSFYTKKMARVGSSVPTPLRPFLEIEWDIARIISILMSNAMKSFVGLIPTGPVVSFQLSSIENKTAAKSYGCTCTECKEFYEYAERVDGFVCRKCKSYRYMVMGSES
jgi:hypothetical protein